MDEARRFLRFVLPGLIVIPQFLLILYLNHDLKHIDKYVDIGLAIVAFLTSGIIGFIFSNLYYIIYWEFYLQNKKLSKLNYLELIKTNNDLLKDFLKNEPTTQREAWPILNAYFNLKYGDKLQYFERKTDSISNILAAIGTTLITLVCVCIIGEIWFLHDLNSRIVYLSANLLISIVLIWNYQLAANILQNLYIRIFEWLNKNPTEDQNNK